MKKVSKIIAVLYLSLCIVVTITLMFSLFFEVSEVWQISLLLQGVAYAFMSGLCFKL